MALGSIQPLTDMSTRSISWGKGGRCVRLTTYHHPVPLSRNLGKLNFLEPSGPVQACNGNVLPLPWFIQKLRNCCDNSMCLSGQLTRGSTLQKCSYRLQATSVLRNSSSYLSFFPNAGNTNLK